MARAVLVIPALILSLMLIGISHSPAVAVEKEAVLLKFNPEEDHATRYMFQLMLLGAHISPGFKNEIGPFDFMIGTVYKDTVIDSLMGLNRHRVNFYQYNVREADFAGLDRTDPRFGGNPWPSLPGSGDSGSGIGSNPPASGDFIDGLGLPMGPSGPSSPAQGGPPGPGGPPGGGGGGLAGDMDNAISLDTIRITELEYVTNKQGEILDIDGLDDLQKVSRNRLLSTDDEQEKQYIDINISHIFEWSHLLYLPDYPVYKESLWFHTFPIHVPGLPIDQPVMTKFTYKLLDFRNVGNRKVAVIDMYGVAEWNREWDERTPEELTEFKSWGSMGFTSRYWFDYENNVIFAIERPPFTDWQYMKDYPAFEVQIPYGYPYHFTMSYPGLIITMEFFYNTRVTDISGKPRLIEVEPEEQRRHITLNFICQLEAE